MNNLLCFWFAIYKDVELSKKLVTQINTFSQNLIFYVFLMGSKIQILLIGLVKTESNIQRENA